MIVGTRQRKEETLISNGLYNMHSEHIATIERSKTARDRIERRPPEAEATPVRAHQRRHQESARLEGVPVPFHRGETTLIEVGATRLRTAVVNAGQLLRRFMPQPGLARRRLSVSVYGLIAPSGSLSIIPGFRTQH